jgi:hypothetical protein
VSATLAAVRNVRSVPQWLKIPTLQSSEQQIRDFILRTQNRFSPRRRWHTQRCAQNLWFYLGRHWAEACTELAPGNGVYHFREIYRHSSAAFPRPVDNVVAQSVDNEIARLTRKEYTPDPTLGRNEPEWMAAAKLAKDICVAEMAKQIWEEKYIDLAFDLCINGVAIARTWWDENDVELTLVASPDARKCPQCNSLFASPLVPRSFASLGLPSQSGPIPFQHSGSVREVAPQGTMTSTQADQMTQIEMRHCPLCEQPALLQQYQISSDEAGRQDAVGRPLGVMVPRGDSLVDVINLHEYFPENGGIGVEPEAQKIYSQDKVYALEWLALRLPELEEHLRPEAPVDLLRTNPLYAERALTIEGFGAGTGMGFETYYNHARLRELVIQPMPFEGLEKGAHFLMVNDHVVARELCVEVEGEDDVHLVPRVKYHFARFKRIPKHFWGRSFVDDMIPLQRRLNEIDAQAIDLRERGKPNIWAPSGTELYIRDEEATGSMSVIEYDSPVSGWSPKEGIFPGLALSGDAYLQERAQVLQALQRSGAPQDIEMGQSPGGVKTTSGLMLVSEEAAAKRAPRERAMVHLCETTFEHILHLNWAFRREDAMLEVQRASGILERQKWTGTDLLGGFKVKMSARIAYDQVLYNKEAAGEAMDRGLYVVDSPMARDRILDLMRLPKDVNESTTLQITRATMAWSDFIGDRTIPVIDPWMDDPQTWWAVLGRAWYTDEALMFQRKVGWSGVLPRLADWPQRLAEIDQQEALTKPIYGKIPPAQWDMVYQQGSELAARAKQAHDQAMQHFSMMTAKAPAGAAPPPPPPAPPMDQFPKPPQQPYLPDPLEQRIYAVWLQMLPELAAAQGAQAPDDTLSELTALLKIYAVIQAYRVLVKGASPMGAPPMPPGAGPAPSAPTGPPASPAGAPPGAGPS